MKTLEKPLNCKAYGSIPHVSFSHRTHGDHLCNPGQEDIVFGNKKKPYHNIIMEEKLDGSCVSVAKVNGELVTISRNGFRCMDSNHVHHRYFDKWAMYPENKKRFDSILSEGERVVGEWLMKPHGQIYILHHEPFVAFDIFGHDNKRLIRSEMNERLDQMDCPFIIPWKIREIHITRDQYDGKKIIGFNPEYVKFCGNRLASTPPEGIIFRVENIEKKRVDFLLKWVRRCYPVGSFLNIDDAWNYYAKIDDYGNFKKMIGLEPNSEYWDQFSEE